MLDDIVCDEHNDLKMLRKLEEAVVMGDNQHTFDISSNFVPSVNDTFMTSWK